MGPFDAGYGVGLKDADCGGVSIGAGTARCCLYRTDVRLVLIELFYRIVLLL